jgi:hypothetical protein
MPKYNPLEMQAYKTYGIYLFCVLAGFLLRWVKERRRGKRIDVFNQAVISVVVSYVAYLWYRDKSVTLCSLELWLIGWSYFANLALNIGDQIFEVGFKTYFKILGNKYNEHSQNNNPLKNDE